MPLSHWHIYWIWCCQEKIHSFCPNQSVVFVDKKKICMVYLTPNEKYLEEVCQELIKVKSEIFA